jgi:uncharacterized membrane protein YkoI
LVLALVGTGVGTGLGTGTGVAAHDEHDRQGGPDWQDAGHSYDRARRAAARGEILSLEAIYARAAARFPGRVLEAELEWDDAGSGHEGPHWVYELKLLETGGRLRKVYLDAHTGTILDHEEDD